MSVSRHSTHPFKAFKSAGTQVYLYLMHQSFASIHFCIKALKPNNLSGIFCARVFSISLSRGMWGKRGANVQGNHFSIAPAVQGNLQGFNIGTVTPVRFSVVGLGLRAGLLPSAGPHRVGHIPGL